MRQNILIVDDDEAVVNALTRVLHGSGYDITPLKSGEEALAYLQDHKADMIISDYQLKGMNGVDLLEAVNRKLPEIVAILLTGQADVRVAADAVNRLSLYKFFVKPWNNDELQAAVREAFKKRGGVKSRGITATDIMSKFPVTIKVDMPLEAAAELMMRFKISGLPVMSLSGKITGIITATDLFRVMGEQEEKLDLGGNTSEKYFRVDEVMSRTVQIIKQGTTLHEMVRMMFELKIHTMPVVEEGELVGIVGRRDVLNAYYRSSHNSKK